MERLLKKLLRNTARIVQNRNDESWESVIVIEESLHPNVKRYIEEYKVMLEPTHCLLDEHARVITDDSEIVFIHISNDL